MGLGVAPGCLPTQAGIRGQQGGSQGLITSGHQQTGDTAGDLINLAPEPNNMDAEVGEHPPKN